MLPHAPLLRNLVFADFPIEHVQPAVGSPPLFQAGLLRRVPYDPNRAPRACSRASGEDLTDRLLNSTSQSLPVTHLASNMTGHRVVMGDIDLPRLTSLLLVDGRVNDFRFTESMAHALTLLEIHCIIHSSGQRCVSFVCLNL